MGITSLQVCMDSSDDWLQGTVSEEGTDQTSSDHDILVACSGTLIERRLRPPHEQSLKCPRCESTHTKFCYYNNYSLSQPRYFCKTCRRYWTKGGTLRNIPVGGGCRKNKKVSTSSKKNNSNEKNNNNDSSNNYNNDHNVSVNHSPGSLLSSSSTLVQPSNNLNNGLMSPSPSAFSCFNLNSHNNNPSSADLHRSFIPEMPFVSLSSNALGFLTSDATNPIFILENNPTPINFMVENTLVGGGQDFMGLHGENFDGVNVINDGLMMTTYNNANIHGMAASSLDHHDMSMTSPAVNNNNNAIMVESFQRMMMPYDQNHHHHHDQHLIIDDHQIQEVEDVKPISTRILPLEWHDYNNHLHHRNTNSTTEIKDHSFGYNLGRLGSWTSLMNGHGSSATNPLV